MFGSFISTIVALAAAQTALAGVYITSPVATTNAIGGQVLTVKWADNGQSPSVAEVGPSSIDLYTGSVNQQTFLQNLAASVDVSKTDSISAMINATVGESGPNYFVRFRSLALKDATNPQYNYQAYSAKFDIEDMTGKFNATVLAQISADPNQPSNTRSTTAVVAAATSKTPAAASASASGTQSTGAAGHAFASPALAVVAVMGAASYLVL